MAVRIHVNSNLLLVFNYVLSRSSPIIHRLYIKICIYIKIKIKNKKNMHTNMHIYIKNAFTEAKAQL